MYNLNLLMSYDTKALCGSYIPLITGKRKRLYVKPGFMKLSVICSRGELEKVKQGVKQEKIIFFKDLAKLFELFY